LEVDQLGVADWIACISFLKTILLCTLRDKTCRVKCTLRPWYDRTWMSDKSFDIVLLLHHRILTGQHNCYIALKMLLRACTWCRD
jgi:hypothetical protein